MTILSPVGGETWYIGESIQFHGMPRTTVVSYISIEYSTNGGSVWSTIISNTINDGSYSWIVPIKPTSSARVKVTAYDATVILDTTLVVAILQLLK